MQGVGLTASDIADDDMAACQQVGAAASRLSRGGLLVSSARAPGTNLVVLIDPERSEDSLVILERTVIEGDA